MAGNIVKITEGHVKQTFDDEGNLIEQRFVASDSEYEDDQGEPIDCPASDPYHPFFMIQPPKKSQ